MYQVPSSKQPKPSKAVFWASIVAITLILVSSCLLGFTIIWGFGGGLCFYADNEQVCRAALRTQAIAATIGITFVIGLGSALVKGIRRGWPRWLLLSLAVVIILLTLLVNSVAQFL